MALENAFHRDDGSRNVPSSKSEWADWVSASKGRNFVLGEPLLDWLNLYGKKKGFVPDKELPDYDPRFDFLKFILGQGNVFEEAVLRWLEERFDIVHVSSGWRDTLDPAAVERTFQAMVDGREIIAQAVLWNPETRTYGAPDLLVRSDILNRIVPDTLSPEEAGLAAPALGGASHHYRVVDIKMSTLHLYADGHVNKKHGPYMTQLWIYNAALGRMQGFTPDSAYLLGRSTIHRKERSVTALDRLGRVDQDYVFHGGDSLADKVADVCAWIRRVRSEGRDWDVLPEPSVPELRPNTKDQTGDWRGAKGQIARALGLGNRSPVTTPLVAPSRIEANEEMWRTPAAAEFFVDFETTLDLDDTFDSFPQKGSSPLIYMIGCGWLDDPLDASTWQFRCFITNRLTEQDEAQTLDEWIAFMRQACAARGTTLDQARLYHWFSAEPSFLDTSYNSPVKRHNRPDWSGLPWLDLHKMFTAEPILVGGTSGYGLKEIARAFHDGGLIDTLWAEGVGGGMEAMAGAWWADTEAERIGGSMRDTEVMPLIERYNEIDCRVMAEILVYLRRER